MRIGLLRLALTLFILFTALPTKAEPVNPVPFTASYAVAYRGLNGGLLRFELRTESPGVFVYETRVEPSLLAQFLVGGEAVERSVMRIDANGVQPLSWFVEDGKIGNKQDGALVFTWEKGRVSGTIKGQPVELQTVPGLQDRLSIQIAVMTLLLRGDEPDVIAMIGDDEIKRYSYTRVGTEQIRTKIGEFATVLFESTRPGSSRVSRFWQAPALGYLPVRVEQVRDGKVETVLELVAMSREESGDR